MKAKIKKGMLILEVENKKEKGKIKKFFEENSASVSITKNRYKLVYWKINDIRIVIT